ncbi:hypothetical protein P4S73_18115 [Paraglaciecola sp. Hal342]
MDTIRDIRVDYHWAQLIPAIDTNRAVVLEELTKAQLAVTGALSDPAAVAIKQIADRVMVQAQVLAFNDLFLWIGAMYACALPLMFLSVRHKMKIPAAPTECFY